MNCFNCGKPINRFAPHVTTNWHVEKIGRIFGWIKVLDCRVIRIYCMDCGRGQVDLGPAPEAAP
jgi:hypothetical protein